MGEGLPPDRFRSWVASALFLRAMQQTTKYKKITSRIHLRAESKTDIRYSGITKIHTRRTFGNRTDHWHHPVPEVSEQSGQSDRQWFTREKSSKCQYRRLVGPIHTNSSLERLSFQP